MKKTLLSSLLFVFALVLFAGCSVNPSKVSDEYAKKYAEKLTYVKDKRTNLCFAVIASRETADTDQTGICITEVPCENVKHLLVE